MYSELTNMLPLERQRAFARDYYFRLGVVVAFLLTALAVAAILLLLPSYILLVDSARSKEAHLAKIQSTFSSVDEAALAGRLAVLSNNASVLTALARAPSASANIRSMLAISRPGITLSGFSYAPPTGTAGVIIVITGSAATRDALRQYQLALQGTPRVVSADLPVSVYAKDANIAFSIKVLFAL